MKKLKLNKKNISRLTDMQMSSVKGGISTYGCTSYTCPENTQVGSGCVTYPPPPPPTSSPCGGQTGNSGYGCSGPGTSNLSLDYYEGECL